MVKKQTAKTTAAKPAVDPRGRATSYDVAAHAGVSQSAVSRCFKPGASVSKKMRDRVNKAVKELGYRPNAIARGLITKRSNMVGVIVSNLNFYPEVLSELNKRFIARGVHVLLFSLDSESNVGSILEEMWQYPVDGVVAAAHLTHEQISLFEERGVPLVFYNRAYRDMPVSSVCCDQVEGERMLVNHLLDHTNPSCVGIVTGPKDSVVSMERTQGALVRLKERGVKKVFTVEGDYTYESGRRSVAALIEKANRVPDAIICANDSMAMGCMDELRYKLELDVPGDVSVVGFDGMKTSAWASFNLTTVIQPVESMAEAAVTMLLDRVDNDHLPPEKRTFSGVLRSGNSVAR